MERVPKPRHRSNEDPPADWDICYVNNEALWRCPAYQLYMNGEIRRCTVCKRKKRWMEHIGCKHNFSKAEKDDDQRMISIIRSRIENRKSKRTDIELRKEILNSIAKIAGQCDISITKSSSTVFKEFAKNMINIGIHISRNYGDAIPNLDNFLYPMNERNIRNSMYVVAIEDKTKRLEAFQKKRCANLLVDAGTVLGYKCVHAMLAHPGIDDALPFEVYENHNFTQLDYMSFYNDVIKKTQNNNVQVSSVIVDQLPAQIKGLNLFIESSNSTAIKSIIIVPCICHLTSLMLSTSIHTNARINEIVKEIEQFTVTIRKPSVVKYLGSKCPKIIPTRWLYIVENLNYILNHQEELNIYRYGQINFPNIPSRFWKLYDIILPIKILNVLGSRRDSRLCKFVQYIQVAIEDYRSLLVKYSDDEEALEILNEITSQFFARIITWKCFRAMVASYLCTPQGKQQFQQIVKMIIETNDEDKYIKANTKVFPESMFKPTYYDLKSHFEIAKTKWEIKDSDEDNDDDQIIEIIPRKTRKELKQKKITSYGLDNFVLEGNDFEETELTKNLNDIEPEDTHEQEDEIVFNQELSRQKIMALDERLNQFIFNGPMFSIYKIAREYIGEFSTNMGYFPDHILHFFDLWINTNNEDLPFKDFITEETNVDDLWEKAAELSFQWAEFSVIGRRLVMIGTSEADVERLFSQQKDAVGQHMTNIGDQNLSSRLILRSSIKNK